MVHGLSPAIRSGVTTCWHGSGGGCMIDEYSTPARSGSATPSPPGRRSTVGCMPLAAVNGLSIAYDVVGDGRPWVITPGGRFSRQSPGVRELAHSLAEGGNRVLIWDRPNTGESDV